MHILIYPNEYVKIIMPLTDGALVYANIKVN